MKSIKIVAALAIILAVAWFGYRHFATPHPDGGMMGMPGGSMAPPVSVAAAIERDVQQWNEFSGRLVAVERVEIRPRVSGAITAIHFTEGAIVKKGAPLFTIDPRPYAAEVTRAEGALASAQAQLELGKREFARAQRLVADKTMAQRAYDERQNNLRVAEANLKSARASLEAARLNLDYTRITAPISGRAGRAELTLGNLVEAGPNAPVLTSIVSNAPIYADFEVDEQSFLAYASAKAAGKGNNEKIPVMLALAGEHEATHQGYLQSFDNRLNAATGTIRVRAVFDNPDGSLIDGLYARVRVGAARGGPVVLITDRAVGTDQSKKFVYVVGEDHKVAYREITLGGVAEGLRVVREGLKAGENIVVNGLQRVRPGAEVQPQQVAMEHADAPPAAATPATEAERTPPEADATPADTAPAANGQ